MPDQAWNTQVICNEKLTDEIQNYKKLKLYSLSCIWILRFSDTFHAQKSWFILWLYNIGMIHFCFIPLILVEGNGNCTDTCQICDDSINFNRNRTFINLQLGNIVPENPYILHDYDFEGIWLLVSLYIYHQFCLRNFGLGVRHSLRRDIS